MAVSELSLIMAGVTSSSMMAAMRAKRDSLAVVDLLKSSIFVESGLAAYHDNRGGFMVLVVGRQEFRTTLDEDASIRIGVSRLLNNPTKLDLIDKRGNDPADNLRELYENTFVLYLFDPSGQGSGSESKRWSYLDHYVTTHPYDPNKRLQNSKEFSMFMENSGLGIDQWFTQHREKHGTHKPVVDYTKGISLLSLLA